MLAVGSLRNASKPHKRHCDRRASFIDRYSTVEVLTEVQVCHIASGASSEQLRPSGPSARPKSIVAVRYWGSPGARPPRSGLIVQITLCGLGLISEELNSAEAMHLSVELMFAPAHA